MGGGSGGAAFLAVFYLTFLCCFNAVYVIIIFTANVAFSHVLTNTVPVRHMDANEVAKLMGTVGSRCAALAFAVMTSARPKNVKIRLPSLVNRTRPCVSSLRYYWFSLEKK